MATYTDQFYEMDPANPPPNGSTLTVVDHQYEDFDDDGFISPGIGDEVNGSEVTAVWEGDRVRVQINGQKIWVKGVTFYTADGGVYFTPTDGTILEDATLLNTTNVNTSTQVTVADLGPPCFHAGTMIETPGGAVAIEDLRVGDLVLTLDEGPQPIRWIGQRKVNGSGDYAPVRFAPGAVGNDRELLVSPQHRMLLTGWRAQLLFGHDEVLVAACHLENGRTIVRTPRRIAHYFHILFDTHQIVRAEGALSESFHPGETILNSDAALRAELFALFPKLATREGRRSRETARPVVPGKEARALGDQAPAFAA